MSKLILFLQVLAVVDAIGQDDLAKRLRQLEESVAKDLMDFLSPLERKKGAVSADLAALMRHLDHQPEDSPDVCAMKDGLADMRLLLDVLALIKVGNTLLSFINFRTCLEKAEIRKPKLYPTGG